MKIKLLVSVIAIVSIAACSPEIGSDTWCEAMVDKPKGDWTANEATDFAKNCVFKSYDND